MPNDNIYIYIGASTSRFPVFVAESKAIISDSMVNIPSLYSA